MQWKETIKQPATGLFYSPNAETKIYTQSFCYFL